MWERIKKIKLKGGYKIGKIEKGFEAEIMKYLRNEGFICHHNQDVGLAAKFLDCYFLSPEGISGWIEFKKIKNSSFNIKQFEDNQVILLKKMDERNPDLARVFIYSMQHNDYKIFTFSELRENKNDKGGIKIFDKNNLG